MIFKEKEKEENCITCILQEQFSCRQPLFADPDQLHLLEKNAYKEVL